MGKEKESAKSTREKAAAARAAQQAAERRRERTVRIVGAIGVVVVVALIIGLAVIVPRLSGDNGGGGGNLPGPDANAPIPAGTLAGDSEYPWGVPYGDAPDTAPVLQLWEDFQCPACASLEQLNGAGIESLATSGQVQLIYRPTGFLDNNLGTEYSARAINAWGCAIDAGKTAEYHNILFANHPEPEGSGWTQEQFLGFGEQVGITGADYDTFSQCVTDGRYLPWAANSTAAFYDAQVPGTPTGVLNGTALTGAQLADQAELERLVAEAAAAG